MTARPLYAHETEIRRSLQRCRLVTAGTLLTGFGISSVIYLTAVDIPGRS